MSPAVAFHQNVFGSVIIYGLLVGEEIISSMQIAIDDDGAGEGVFGANCQSVIYLVSIFFEAQNDDDDDGKWQQNRTVFCST